MKESSPTLLNWLDHWPSLILMEVWLRQMILVNIKIYSLLDVRHEIRIQLLTELLADTLIHSGVHLKRQVCGWGQS